MQCLGFTEKQQHTIFQIVAAVLHSGNIEFTSHDDEQCTIDGDDYNLACFCELLGILLILVHFTFGRFRIKFVSLNLFVLQTWTKLPP